MPGRQLGDAYITISPDTRLFRTMTDAQVRKELAGFNPKVRIGADTKSAQVAITSFQKRVGDLSKQLSGLRADATTKDAESKIVRVQGKVLDLARQMRDLTMSADAKKLDAQIAGEVAKLKGLQAQMSNLQADANTKAAAAKIAALTAQAAHLQEALDKGKLKSDIDIRAAETKIKSIDAELRVLGGNARAVKLAADSRSILTQIEVVKASLAGLQSQARDIKLGTSLDPAKILASESALLGLEHIVENLGKKDAPAANTAMGAFFRSMNKGSTAASYGWKILTGHITLFGGVFNKLLPAMFTSVAVWHLLLDAAIEIVAVWAPAIVAVTAFGLAAKNAATEVYNRMQAVNTVMHATGQVVAPLGNQFNQLADKVRPEVYQLFGDALIIMNKRSGAFNTVATETGRVLDQLGARFVYAVTNGSSVNKFMEHAVSDVARLGDSFANLGGIFGAVFRAVPGYAEILLKVGDAILHVISVAAQAGEPIIAVGLALHGFFIYGGAAVTMSLALVAGVVKLIGAFGKFNEAVTLVGLNSLKSFALGLANGVKGLVAYSGALISLARSEGVAAAGSIALADAQALLSKVPAIFWVTLAASAIAGLVIWLRSAHSATQDFVSGLQKTVAAAQLSDVLTTIQGAQVRVTSRLAAAQRTLANTTEYVTTANLHTGQAITAVSGAYTAAKGNVDALKGAQQQLGDQYKLVSGRISDLARTYGGNTQALGALNAAGITTSQILDKNSQHWALALIQVDATAQAYRAMGTQAGTLGNDLDVLGRTVTSQYTATQKLNQAWSSFISDVTSTQGSLDTVIQGFSTLSDHTGTLKLSLGKLKVSYADTRAAIDSLTPAGVALNQAFTDQVGNVDKLFASWRTAGLAQNLFTEGVKVAIAPLTKYAAGSREATAQLVALAQEAGYQGPVSMAALTKWLGNTHDATQRLKNIADQATQQEALLTGSMKAQGDMIANKLIGDINNAILAYNGVEKAAAAYGDAIARDGAQSDQAKQARDRLIKDIIASGRAAGDTTQQIAALITKVTGIPPSKAIKIVATAEGSGGVKVTASQAGIAAKIIALNKLGLAGGGYVNYGSGPTADDVPAMLSRGELVVPANMVQSGAVDHLRGALPGFASGGAVGSVGAAGTALTQYPAAVGAAVGDAAGAALSTDLVAVIQAMKAEILGSGPAVLQYAMSFLHKVPYVWGGSTPSGWDCSGFVSYVYDHFKLFSGRTDAAGLQNWARASAPTPGGLAFYGTPAHHVGFVVDGNTLLSALGAKWGTTESSLNLGDNSGYGVPPQGFGSAGGVPGGGALPKGKLQELAFSLLNQYGWGNQWNAFNLLETREAGWSMTARNPSSGAYGLAQFINGPSEYFQYGGDPNTGLGQLTAMMNYIAQRYPPGPNAAWAHEVADNWYGKGGLVGMASGGRIPLGKYLPQLKAAQSNEHGDYAGLRKAYLGDIAHAVKGSWTSGHKAGIRSELATLAKRQSAEEAAYDNILHHGTARANLSKFGTRVRAVATTSRDKDLSHSHPGWSHGLQYWLGVLSHLSQADVAPVYGGTQAKLQFPAWLAKARAAQAAEVTDYRGLENSFAVGLRHAGHGTWLYKNRKAIGERLYAVAIRQNAEAAAWNDLNKHATGSISDLAGLAGRIGKLGTQAAAEAGSLQPALLGHLPGGHPGWVRALQAQLKALASLSAAPPFNPPWAPGNLGPSHSAPGGVLRFDTGRGVLAPGMNLAWNGTGRAEALSASGAGSGGTVTLEFAGGGSDLEQLLFQIIRRTVRVRGGGNVQTAFGRGS